MTVDEFKLLTECFDMKLDGIAWDGEQQYLSLHKVGTLRFSKGDILNTFTAEEVIFLPKR